MTTRLSSWRNLRYQELQDALAEFIAALNSVLYARGTQASSVFLSDEPNEKLYGTIYTTCRDRFESVRSSGRLSESGFKVADQEIGKLVRALTEDSMRQILAMADFRLKAIEEFRESGTVPGSATRYWPEQHAVQLAEIAERTHQINEMIEQRISLPD